MTEFDALLGFAERIADPKLSTLIRAAVYLLQDQRYLVAADVFRAAAEATDSPEAVDHLRIAADMALRLADEDTRKRLGG